MDIKNHDIYEYAIIMSSRCWPHYIEGNNINKQFSGKAVGGMDALCGDLENFPLHVFYMKEEDYCMIPMYTYWKNERVGDEKPRTIVEVRTRFNLLENVQNHYKNRDTVD